MTVATRAVRGCRNGNGVPWAGRMLILGPMIPARKVFSGDIDFGLLAELFIVEYTRPGDLVLDPFAGSGETVARAVGLGRRGLGIEIVPERVAAARQRVGPELIIDGDARRLRELDLPVADLVVTSPPLMTVGDHPQNPLSGYQTLDGDYAEYLDTLKSIMISLVGLIRPGGRIVLNVWNFSDDGQYTPLADDLERALDGVLPLEQTVEISWPGADAPPTNDRCLIYRRSIMDP
jgi:SAM-dependent methyltransferase